MESGFCLDEDTCLFNEYDKMLHLKLSVLLHCSVGFSNESCGSAGQNVRADCEEATEGVSIVWPSENVMVTYFGEIRDKFETVPEFCGKFISMPVHPVSGSPAPIKFIFFVVVG